MLFFITLCLSEEEICWCWWLWWWWVSDQWWWWWWWWMMQGSVEFIESDEFRVEVNATSSSVDQLARFHYNFTYLHGSLLLQMVWTVIWLYTIAIYLALADSRRKIQLTVVGNVRYISVKYLLHRRLSRMPWSEKQHNTTNVSIQKIKIK